VEQTILARLAGRIREYQDRFDRFFPRAETRRWAREYVAGLLMDIERKN